MPKEAFARNDGRRRDRHIRFRAGSLVKVYGAVHPVEFALDELGIAELVGKGAGTGWRLFEGFADGFGVTPGKQTVEVCALVADLVVALGVDHDEAVAAAEDGSEAGPGLEHLLVGDDFAVFRPGG